MCIVACVQCVCVCGCGWVGVGVCGGGARRCVCEFFFIV